MEMPERRYIPLLTEDGQFIPRPDYMVLAALSDPEPDGMQLTYEIMLREQELRPHADAKGMTKAAGLIKSKLIDANSSGRVLVGEVVIELARIAQATGKPPSVKDARRLVAFNQHRMTRKSTPDNLVREVEKHFSKYRNVAHLWAAAVYHPQLITDLEGEEQPLRAFLGLARAFETFIDNNIISGSFSWEPFRIPERFPATWEITFMPLTADELKFLASR